MQFCDCAYVCVIVFIQSNKQWMAEWLLVEFGSYFVLVIKCIFEKSIFQFFIFMLVFFSKKRKQKKKQTNQSHTLLYAWKNCMSMQNLYGHKS